MTVLPMTHKNPLAVLIISLFLIPVASACEYPERAEMANGMTATKEEMVASQRSVKAYITAMEDYLACIEAEESDAVDALNEPDEDTLAQRKTVFNKKYNAAVDEMQLIAAEFNEQVRAYKGRDE